MDKKRILITGGTSGLGRALALELLRRGASVAIVARGARALHEVKRIAGSTQLLTIQADVAEKEMTYRIAGETLSRLGGIDVLFNNASSLGPTPLRLLLDTGCEDFEQVLQTNLVGAFRLTKALLPAMLLQKSGLVVNISSDAATTAYPGWGIYGASKAALAHLSQILDAEIREHGVRSIALDPGEIDTPMHRAALPDADPAMLQTPEQAAIRLLDQIEKALQ